MPFIDVTDILMDPDFADTINLVRRAETINGYGESVVAETVTAISAVVTAGSQPKMERAPEGQRQPNTLTVHTTTRLVAPADGHQPDMIEYNGRRFVVVKVYDWSRYGAGFFAAECSSVDYLETSP